jgi:hypothetical protein
MTIPGATQSLIDEVEIVEEHLHNEQKCAGDDGANGFEDDGLDAWQLTAPDDGSFGTEVKIYSGAKGSGVFMDLDKVFVTESQRSDDTYIIQIKAGSGIFAAATTVSASYYRTGATTAEVNPLPAKAPRVRGDLSVWARAKCTSVVGPSTIDFVLEYHQYPPPNGSDITS